jgi:hypothetical protein
VKDFPISSKSEMSLMVLEHLLGDETLHQHDDANEQPGCLRSFIE